LPWSAVYDFSAARHDVYNLTPIAMEERLFFDVMGPRGKAFMGDQKLADQALRDGAQSVLRAVPRPRRRARSQQRMEPEGPSRQQPVRAKPSP
jgi:hypothetical protein